MQILVKIAAADPSKNASVFVCGDVPPSLTMLSLTITGYLTLCLNLVYFYH